MAGSPFDACQEAYDRRHGKEVLTKCADAFVAEPRPEIAVMLAKTEFDSGRAAKALDWARKAITIDGGHAEAYVFLGAAEQATGRKAAAKRAYQHYLKLSPHGRHAADLRAVVGSL
jgi:Flp pilus assembly protein TadD